MTVERAIEAIIAREWIILVGGSWEPINEAGRVLCTFKGPTELPARFDLSEQMVRALEGVRPAAVEGERDG